VSLSNRHILFIILLIASFLRLYDYFNIPFTHDEFSALIRLNFDNFYDLIEKGVKVDGHPAGVHVFLYYWTKFFGMSEWVVKLPFTFFGLFSVYLAYLIGKKGYNETVGLITSVYIASLQFTIIYSQIARPYISGLFFGLLMVNYLTNLILNPEMNFKRNICFFILSASLCTYNHHFSLLFAFIVGLTGIILIKKEYRKNYILAGLIVFLLYTPHFKIFFYQFGIGGVGGADGWLGKPNQNFLFQFIYYIFHYSFIAIFLAVVIACLGFIKSKERKINYRFIIVSLIWFITPFLIGYFYSVYRNPVLQYSVLLFSFPFLFFILFAFIKAQSVKVNLILVLIIFFVNVSTLIFQRKHYRLMYSSIYEHNLINYKKFSDTECRTIFLIDSKKKINDYIVAKSNFNKDFILLSEKLPKLIDLKRYLEKEFKRNDKLYLGCISSIQSNIVPLIQDYFPTIENQNNYFGGTTYLFSKRQNKNINYISVLDFDGRIPENWSSIEKNRIVQRGQLNNRNCYRLTKEIEWGPTFSIPLSNVLKNKNNFIDISIDAMSSDSMDGTVLVAALESKGENIYWGGTDFSELYLNESNDTIIQHFHHSIKFSDINLNYDYIELKVFIWNKNKKDLILDNFKIVLRDGNPLIYGLVEKF
jgi:hypothetical protein